MKSQTQNLVTAADVFEHNRYVYLNDTISRSDCEQLTQYMFKLYDEGKLKKTNNVLFLIPSMVIRFLMIFCKNLQNQLVNTLVRNFSLHIRTQESIGQAKY